MNDHEQWERWRHWAEHEQRGQQEGARYAYYNWKERHEEKTMTIEEKRHVIGHRSYPEMDLTIMDSVENSEVSLIQHDRDQSDLILLSYDQMERLVQWWRETHE